MGAINIQSSSNSGNPLFPHFPFSISFFNRSITLPQWLSQDWVHSLNAPPNSPPHRFIPSPSLPSLIISLPNPIWRRRFPQRAAKLYKLISSQQPRRSETYKTTSADCWRLNMNWGESFINPSVKIRSFRVKYVRSIVTSSPSCREIAPLCACGIGVFSRAVLVECTSSSGCLVSCFVIQRIKVLWWASPKHLGRRKKSRIHLTVFVKCKIYEYTWVLF